MQSFRATSIAALLFALVLGLPLASQGEPSLGASAGNEIVPPAPESLADLLAFYAAMPGLEARFEEEKTIALLIEPERELTSATLMLDEGLHSFPVEIRDGVPRAVILDPLTTPPINVRSC